MLNLTLPPLPAGGTTLSSIASNILHLGHRTRVVVSPKPHFHFSMKSGDHEAEDRRMYSKYMGIIRQFFCSRKSTVSGLMDNKSRSGHRRTHTRYLVTACTMFKTQAQCMLIAELMCLPDDFIPKGFGFEHEPRYKRPPPPAPTPPLPRGMPRKPPEWPLHWVPI